MLNVVGKVIGALIQSITAFLFLEEILKNNKEKIKIKDIFSITILTIIILLIHNSEYNTINPITVFLTITIELFFLYRITLTKAILSVTAFMLTLFIADLIATIILAGISTIDVVRESYIFLILVNLIVGVITISLIKIKKLKDKIKHIIEEIHSKDSIEIITFISLSLSALSLILYLMSKNYEYNNLFLISVIGILIFVLLSFIFFKEKYEKEIIVHNYDQLFEYVKTFEEWIDTENMNIHESKNQLATLRDIVKDNKEAIEYIDNIISERIDVESNNIIKLKNIPKGGLKGLLFYKITLAEKQKIDLLIDISDNVSRSLKKLNLDETKNLCRLVGIFFDNAIEAAKETKKKKISLEIYLNDDCLNIVISNTYTGNIEINKIKENGYSTKGKNRGRGLYLANKFSSKNNNFKLENRIINNYYIQKIIIKKEH